MKTDSTPLSRALRCIPLDYPLQKQLTASNPAMQTCFANLPLYSADGWLTLTDGIHAYGWLSLWWQSTPEYHQQKTGCIGYYHADNADTAAILLAAAQTSLREQGIRQVIAPMNGNTWHAYRLTLKTTDHPAFFMDLDTPPEWNEHFIQAGFEAIARYASTCSDKLDYDDSDARRWQERFETQSGCFLHSLQPDNVDLQLRSLYELSLQGFRYNFLYTDITQAEFEALYRPVLAQVDPELVQMAYVDGQLAGFVFCMPDYAQKARGEAIDTLILKTLVRHPDPALKGLGAFLAWNAHRMAYRRGYRHIIYAFMHEHNASMQMGLKMGRIIREYSLYGKTL